MKILFRSSFRLIRSRLFPALLIMAGCFFAWNSTVDAQSVAVQLPGRAESAELGASEADSVESRYPDGLKAHNAAGSFRQQNGPPNNMSPKMRLWEAILDQTYPDAFEDEMPASEMIAELNQMGLPVVLDQSARDDAMSFDEPMLFQVSGVPLRGRLMQALQEKNATITFRPDFISIISLDDAEDSKYFMTVIYDVTDLNMPPQHLVNLIENTISNDSWLATGQGLGTLQGGPVQSRNLLFVSQTYGVHREVQELLAGIRQLGGAAAPAHVPFYGSTVPQVVPQILPQANSEPKPANVPDPRANGGVFNAPNLVR